MLPTRASMRARALKQGFPLKIWTECELIAAQKEREKPVGIENLLKAFDPGVQLNQQANWPWEDHEAWRKL